MDDTDEETALAATFDDALRTCVDQMFDGKEPIQAFPLDVEAAAMADGPPECEYRVPLRDEETGNEIFARYEAVRERGGWRFTYLDFEER